MDRRPVLLPISRTVELHVMCRAVCLMCRVNWMPSLATP